MSISDYVKMNDINGMNEHYRKAIRSLLKLHPTVAESFMNNQMKLIDAMMLAWIPHKNQLEWLPRVVNQGIDLVHYLCSEPSS